MNDACAIMVEKISRLVQTRAGLAEIPFRGEYAGTDEIQCLELGRLTQEELTNLFEFCIRFDEMKETAEMFRNRLQLLEKAS